MIDAHLRDLSKLIWDEKKKILLTGSYDKSIKLFQLPLYWPSELIRKYKSKNSKKILFNTRQIEEEENLSKPEANEMTEQKEYYQKNKNSAEMNTLNKHMADENKIKCENNLNEAENPSGNSMKDDSKAENVEDDDYLISKSIAKLKYELSEREKICEDLHGWDEDY